jgi:hypothetical protein
MTWFHALPWQWLESLAMVLFWTLVIVLALAPINYLRDQLNEQSQEAEPPLPKADTSVANASAHASPTFHAKT